MRFSTLTLAFVLMAYGVWPHHEALGADIIDNTLDGSATLFSSYLLSTNERGMRFTVLNTPITINNITFGLACLVQGLTSEIGVKLYTGAGGNGGTLLYDSGTSLLSLNNISNGAGYYSYAVNWQLNSNQTYTVMVYNGFPSSPSFPLVAETSMPLLIDPNITGGGFFNNTSLVADNYAIRIEAIVPEPSTCILGTLAAFTLAVMARRRHRTA